MTQPVFIEYKVNINEVDFSVSEEINLPEGTLIDLRFSGTMPGENKFSTFTESTDAIIVLFDKTGAPDRMVFGGRKELLQGSLSFLVRAYRDFDQNLEEFSPGNPVAKDLAVTRDILSHEDSMWVHANVSTGRISIFDSVPPTTEDTISQLVTQSKAFTRSQ